MAKTSLIEKSTAAFRNLLALLIVLLIISSILIISFFYFDCFSDDKDVVKNIYGTLIPLFATWIGTILAFYFGRENFEAASNRYDQIINKLSPDLLDNVEVSQIMITRKTMVAMQFDEAKNKSVNDLLNFLKSVDKTRLPILEGNKIKYVIHSSTLLKAKSESTQTPMNFETFVKKYGSIILLFEKALDDKILEDILTLIKKDPSKKDVFIVDSNDNVKGWLTDTLILRYMKG